jgi:hypothetical protein
MADGVGFEPTRGVTPAGFQDRCFQPLSHPSWLATQIAGRGALQRNRPDRDRRAGRGLSRRAQGVQVVVDRGWLAAQVPVGAAGDARRGVRRAAAKGSGRSRSDDASGSGAGLSLGDCQPCPAPIPPHPASRSGRSGRRRRRNGARLVSLKMVTPNERRVHGHRRFAVGDRDHRRADHPRPCHRLWRQPQPQAAQGAGSAPPRAPPIFAGSRARRCDGCGAADGSTLPTPCPSRLRGRQAPIAA